MRALYFIHKILLAVSFACLFEFGIAVLPSTGRVRGFHWLSISIFTAWAFVVFIVFPGDPNDLEWRRIANALAR
jgi:hypothetical protein